MESFPKISKLFLKSLQFFKIIVVLGINACVERSTHSILKLLEIKTQALPIVSRFLLGERIIDCLLYDLQTAAFVDGGAWILA